MKNWKKTKLNDIADIVMGQSPKSETYNLDGDGLPFYQGVTEFGDRHVSVKTYTNKPTKIAESGDILFSVRAPVGRINYTKHKCCIGRGNAAFRMKNGNQDYLFYLLKYLERNINNYKSGTVFDSISGAVLKNIEIDFVDSVDEQKAIAKVLSSLDDKIELLREENETLEKTAQAVFKEWFVNFNFPFDFAQGKPDKNGKPYKDNGGKMVESELGEIPEGWRVGSLGDVITYIIDNRGKTPSIVEDGYPMVEVNSIMGNDRCIDLSVSKKKVDKETYDNWFRKGHPIKGDILISTVGSIGEIAMVFNEVVCIAQNVIGIRVGNYKYFIYELLKYVKKQLISLNISSVQPSIKVPHLLSLEIVKPEESIIKKFNFIIESMVEKINNNNNEIQTLTKTRDTLLPKLMSGELRVKF